MTDSCTYRESGSWGASWIGGRLSDGVWIWDGIRQEKIAVTAWKAGEPDGGGQNCLARLTRGRWYDEECGRRLPYTCERA